MKKFPTSNSKAAPTRVVLVDDHVSLRQMLTIALRQQGCYQVVGEAGGGMEALKVCRATRPDLVILDLLLPELGGAHLIRLLLQEPWPVRVVVYSGVGDEGLLWEALAEGPHGFVRKDGSLPELLAALRAVGAGSRYISARVEHLAMMANGDALRALTTQERAVLQMIAEGRQNKAIATALGISVKTAEHHRQHVMDKLGLHDVASLTRYAVRHRLVSV